MASPGANLLKRMKLGGTRRSEEFIPGIRSESGDACKTCLYVAKVHRPNQPGELRTKGAQTRVSVPVLADAHHQKDRRPRKRTDHSLGENDFFELARGVHFSISICVGFSPEYRILARPAYDSGNLGNATLLDPSRLRTLHRVQ